MVTPPITLKQAKKSVKLLEKLGMISRQKNGIYRITDKSITTGKEVISLAVQNFHVECTKLAEKAIQQIGKKERNITGLTLGISKKSYDLICGQIQYFQERIMNIANSDDEADRVYQLNFHLFPLSENDKERIKRRKCMFFMFYFHQYYLFHLHL